MPVAWKTASNEAGEVRSVVAEQESDVLEPLAEGEGEVAGLLHGPLAGGVGGDAAEVHPAGAVLDEHQHVHALQQHGVHVQEVDREDPGGLGVQELPPRRARAARRRIDPDQDERRCQTLPQEERLRERNQSADVEERRRHSRFSRHQHGGGGRQTHGPDCTQAKITGSACGAIVHSFHPIGHLPHEQSAEDQAQSPRDQRSQHGEQRDHRDRAAPGVLGIPGQPANGAIHQRRGWRPHSRQ